MQMPNLVHLIGWCERMLSDTQQKHKLFIFVNSSQSVFQTPAIFSCQTVGKGQGNKRVVKFKASDVVPKYVVFRCHVLSLNSMVIRLPICLSRLYTSFQILFHLYHVCRCPSSRPSCKMFQLLFEAMCPARQHVLSG